MRPGEHKDTIFVRNTDLPVAGCKPFSRPTNEFGDQQSMVGNELAPLVCTPHKVQDFGLYTTAVRFQVRVCDTLKSTHSPADQWLVYITVMMSSEPEFPLHAAGEVSQGRMNQ